MKSVPSFRRRLLSATALASVLAFAFTPSGAGALPSGGHYVSGRGSIDKANQSLTVKQSSTTGIIDWNKFSIGTGRAVTFDNGSGATLNRVTGGNISTIAGSLHATGSLYIMNNAGVIVSGTGKVVTGGSFVATSGNLGTAFDSDRRFKAGSGKIVNKGTIVSGGSTTLVGRDVTASGTIRASQVDLAATRKLAVDGVITATDASGAGGTVTARGRTIVIGTDGDIDASASSAHRKGGSISVIARGAATVAGTLKADGGNESSGGFIETSGADVHVADSAKISTLSQAGKTGTWLIDPQDFTIAASGGDMTGAALSAALAINDITIQSSAGTKAGNGDIFVDDAVTWSSGHALTLDAFRNIDVAAPIAVRGGGGIVLIDADTTGTGVNDGNAADGDYFFVNGGNIAFTGGSGSGATLSINGAFYTLLYSMSDVQNINASSTTLQGDYALAASLDATATTGWVPIGTDGANNIGNSGNGFTGSFEGLGNTISNLAVNIGAASDAGLFGYSSGTIRDIGVIGGSNISGGEAGGLAGENHGTISGSYATTPISINGGGAGGLVGDNFGTISESYATGSVGNASSLFLGGLAGVNEGVIVNSYATGAVAGSGEVGGLVGFNQISGTISDSYATGALGPDTGGLVGANNHGSVTDSYWDTETSGRTFSDGGTGLTTAQLTAALPAGFDPSVWGNINNQATPYLIANRGPVYLATDAAHLYTPVFTMAQLQAINASSAALQGNYVLANSLDASSTTGWVPIGTDGHSNILNSSHGFSGIFDGLGDTISDLTVNIAGARYVGPFGYLSGTVRNVGIIGGSVNGDISVGGLVGFSSGGTISNSYATSAVSSGISETGGLVGDNRGTIEGSYATGAVSSSGDYTGGLVGINYITIVDSYATGAVNGHGVQNDFAGGAVIGGLVGENFGSISDSYATGQVVTTGSGIFFFNGGNAGGLVGENDGTISDSFATGNASGIFNIGGLVGQNYGTISDSYAMGAASASNGAAGGLIGENDSAVSDSYAIGAVSGSGNIGGLVGTNTGTIGGSYWDTETSGQNIGIGNDNNSQTVTGQTTEQLQGALPDMFPNGVWSTGAGLFPFLPWQFPFGTPQAVSGFAYSDHGITPLSAGAVSLLIDGTAMGTASSGANGYYYFLVAPGTISGSQVLTYLPGAGGAAFADNVAGSLSGMEIDNNYLDETTVSSSYAAVAGDLAAAIGSNSTVQSIVSGLPNLAIDYTGNGTFTIDSAIDVGGTLILTSAGAIAESGSGAITASSLTGSSAGSTTLNGSNLIGILGNFAITGTGNFALTNAQALTVDGNVNAGSGSLSLTTTGAGDYLALDGGGLTTTGAVSLVSAGDIDGTAFPIVASSLSGSSVGSTTLDGPNIIADLGPFTAGSSFNLADDRSVTVDGAVTSSAQGELTLGADGIVLDGALTGGTIDLESGAAIASNSSGVITATTLTGSSHGAVTLNAANIISNLGDFSTDNGAFALTDAHGLTVTGQVFGSAGALSLTSTGTNNGLFIDGTIEGSTIALVSAAGISETGPGAIQGAMLTGSAHGNVSLIGSNAVTDLGAFSSNGEPLSFFDAAGLTITGAVNAGTNDLTLLAADGTDSISIDAPLTGGVVSLSSAGTITSNSAGVITAAILTGSSVGAVTLNAANVIGDLGDFSTGGNNAFALTDDHSLNTTGAVDAGTAGLTLTTTGSGDGIAIDGVITGGTVNLISAAAIGENTNTGAITAATLTGSSAGLAEMNSAANAIGNLAAFSTKSNVFELTDDHSLTVGGLVNAGTAGVHLTTVGSGDNILLDNTIKADDVYLVSAGTSGENGSGSIDAFKLLGSSAGSTEMNSTLNVIAELGAFTTGNTFELTDGRTLAVEGTVNSGTAGTHLTTVGASGHAIKVDAAISASDLYLVSSGSITESSTGEIDATKLLGSSVNATTLTSALNTITDLGTFSTNGTAAFELTDDRALTVDGAVSTGTGTLDLTTVGSGNNLAINANLTGGTVNLVTAGKATEASAAAIAAARLNVTANTGIVLTSTHNAITKLGTDKTTTGPNNVNL